MKIDNSDVLNDLGEMIEKSKEKLRKAGPLADVELNEKFKEAYRISLKKSGTKIDFFKNTARILKPNNLSIYLPNQWFVLSAYVDLAREILKYRNYTEMIINENGDKFFIEQNKLSKDDVYKKLRDKEDNEVNKIFNLEVRSFFRKNHFPDNIVQENAKLLQRFVSDYSWWHGAKGIERRNDYYVSPVLSVLELVNTSQGYVADIVHLYATDDELYSTALELNNYDDIKDVSEINEETSPYNGKTAENIIYYGAPGTGKSYGVSEYVNDHICENQEKYDASKDDCKYVFRATLHPEYTYSDFVGQVMPVVEKNGDEKSITYDFKPGVFTEALTYAEKHSDEAVFLVLEELSRANVAAVFGDVFQLLDRKDNGRSEYGIDNALIANAVYGDEERKVFIPGNLFIIGTVNTSDQNVFAMDTAFKRRFNWKYVSIDVPEEKKAEFNQDNNPEFMVDGIKTDWLKFYTELDKFITSELGMTEDKQIGPYFIKFRKTGDEYDEPGEIIKDKLLQYLWDDVQGVARNMYAEKTLFLKKFTSYSMLYDAFDKGESVFSNEFISRLGKSVKAAVDEESNQND